MSAVELNQFLLSSYLEKTVRSVKNSFAEVPTESKIPSSTRIEIPRPHITQNLIISKT